MTGTVDFTAIGTYVRLVATDRSAIEPARELVAGWLAEFDLAASRFRSDSELVRINAASAATDAVTVRVSELLLDCLLAARRADRLTAGLVTPAVGRALTAAGYDTDLAVVRARPDVPRVAAPAPTPETGGYLIDPDAATLTLHGGIALDLGASAKARAADRYAAALADRFGGGFLVDLGGDIACAGTPPADGWAVEVTDWRGRNRQVVCVDDNQAIATSSTRLRVWRRAGRPQQHIIDPRTGAPARTFWAQVSCAAPDAVQANAASTAAVVLAGAAPRWLEARGVPALLITDDGTELRLGGWPSHGPFPDIRAAA